MALTLLGFSGLLLTVFVHQCFCAVEKDLVCNDLDCSPQTACACVGNNVTIPWNIPNYPDDIFTVSWTLENATSNIKPVLSQSGSGSPNIEDNFNVVHNGKGSITLISVTTENTGIYKCDVNYNLGSGSPVIGTVTVSVYDTPGDLDYTAVSDTVYQCKAGYDGSPATSLDIWVNGVNQNSDKATVKKSDFVECCRSGKAVRCMSDVSTGCTSIKKCITVQTPHVPFPVWAIVLIVVFLLYVTGIIIGYVKYFCGKCERQCKKNGLEWWVIALCVIIVGFGIITVWAIRKGCCSQGAEKPGDSERNEKSDDL